MKSVKSIVPFILVLVAGGLWLLWQTPDVAHAQPRLPIPSVKAQDKARKLVLDIFGDDLNKASTADAKTRLAAQLFQEGKAVKDDSAVRFICLTEASTLAAKGGDTGLALAIVDELQRGFDVDALLKKADVLGLAAGVVVEKEQGVALVDAIRPILKAAIDLDHYKAAYQLGDAAVNAAKKAKSASLVLEMQKRVEDIQTLEKAFSKVQGLLDRVEKDPKDTAAQLELGRYFAFTKKRWDKAMAYFARSADAKMAAQAKQDLIDPKDNKGQLQVADGWWELASFEKGPIKLALQMRAHYWYEKAIPTLSGLNRTKAQKRVDLVNDQLAGTPTVVTPVAGPAGEFRKFDGHTQEIKGVALSYDGRYAASASRDETVRVWDLTLKENKEAHIIRGHTKEVWAVAFHPNNRYLFSGSWDATVRMWDFKTGTEQKRYTHGKDVNGLVLSRDAGTMLTACDDRHAYLWNVNTGDEIRKFPGHTEYVYAVAFSPDGRYVATGSVDKSVKVFDLSTAQLIKSFDGSSESVMNVAFLPDNRHVLSSGDNVVHVWDIQSGKEARRIEGHQGRVVGMALSPDGRRLLTGGDDRTLKLWDAATGKMLQSWAGHTETITCVAFSPDGRRAITGSYDKSVRIWNLPPR